MTELELDRDLRSLVREIPDFPKPGIGFKDITPLLAEPDALAAAVRALAEPLRSLQIDCVIAAEARGFLLGPALALELGAGFALARKPGKLPYETVSAEYLLEYGEETLELHTDAVAAGTTTPPNLSSMTKFDSTPISVGTEDGGATTPQFKITTDTTTGDPIEFIAIQADCTYLLLNSITSSGPSSVPEPRFYGLLLAGLLCASGVVYQKRRAAKENA